MGRWCGDYGKWNVGGWLAGRQKGLCRKGLGGWVVNNKSSKPAIEAVEKNPNTQEAEGNDERLKIFAKTFLLKTKIGFKDYLFGWRRWQDKNPLTLSSSRSFTFVWLGVIF